MLSRDRIIQWLQDGDERDAAKILAECTLEPIDVDVLIRGERYLDVLDVKVHTPRKTLSDINGSFATYKDQIENAIRECAPSSNAEVRYIEWIPKCSDVQCSTTIVRRYVDAGRIR